MADIFISYSKQDKALAEQLAGLLQEIGFTVWWDADLVPAEEFRDSIRRQIEAARAVIVIWSVNSAKSAFVIDEADVAREAGKLISTLAEGFSAARVPLGFRNAHMTPLADGNALIKALAARGLTPGKPISAFLLALFHDRMASVRKRRTWLLPAALSFVILGLVAWIALNLTVTRNTALPSPGDTLRATYGYEGGPAGYKVVLNTIGARPFYRHSVNIYVLTPDLQLAKKEEYNAVVYDTGSWGPSIAIDSQAQAALAAKGYLATCIRFSLTENGSVSAIGIVRKADDLQTRKHDEATSSRIGRSNRESGEYVEHIQFGAAEASAVSTLSKQHGCDYRL